MPISPTAQALGLLAATLVASNALASDVDPYAEAAPTATPSPAVDTAQPQSSGFFRWFRSNKPKAPVVESGNARLALPALGLPAPLAAPLASSELVANALGLLGINYRRGGNTPDTGFDCSGLVRYVFQNAMGVELPRQAAEISRVGAKVDRQDLKPGDLVFYNTLKKTFSHVGIYLGDHRFIHAPSSGAQVRIEDMNQTYWAKRFDGARRVSD